ncbi:hypothetical protein C8Q78DRAFT_991237 [Trametes maxima]|nr:hypothetical protein C8Q78DRAFT_991237 [Trametes maxima]
MASSFDDSDIIELYNSTYFALASATLVAYDCVVTFDREVKHFWGRKVTGASALFFAIRYSALLNYVVLTTAPNAPVSDALQFTVGVLMYIPWAALSALRVLALSGGLRWPLSILVFTLSVAPVAVNFVDFRLGLSGANVLTIGCQASDNSTLQEGEILVAADAIVVIVTIMKTWKKSTGHVRASGIASFRDILFYNGIAYFTVLCCLNVLSAVLTRLSIFGEISQEGSYVTILSEPLTVILVSRFLLDLQAANHGTGLYDSEILPGAEETLQFASRVLGSLGASVGLGSGQPDIEEDLWLDEGVQDSSETSHNLDVPKLPIDLNGDVIRNR